MVIIRIRSVPPFMKGGSDRLHPLRNNANFYMDKDERHYVHSAHDAFSVSEKNLLRH
jgi:hypothetical protein